MIATPMDPNVNLDEKEDEGKGEKEGKDTDKRRQETYMTAIGSLMYTALTTHPDIAYAVQQLAQFTKHP